MNKTAWMCWFQGPDDSCMPAVNRACLAEWLRLNPYWDVIQLCSRTVQTYAPDYAGIIARSPHRVLAMHSELVRLELLDRHGGVWADASVWPARPLDHWLSALLAPTGFFGFRYVPRSVAPGWTIDVNGWFLAVDRPHHPLIRKWRDKFEQSCLTGPPQSNVLFGVPNMFPYFQMHTDLVELYDTDEEIKQIIDGMPLCSEKAPHSASGRRWRQRKRPSPVYKRPYIAALGSIRYGGSLPS